MGTAGSGLCCLHTGHGKVQACSGNPWLSSAAKAAQTEQKSFCNCPVESAEKYNKQDVSWLKALHAKKQIQNNTLKIFLNREESFVPSRAMQEKASGPWLLLSSYGGGEIP